MTHKRIRPRTRPRRGLTLVEVIVAMAILGGVMIGLGMFSMTLSQSTSNAKFRILAAQAAVDRIEQVKGVSTYAGIDAMAATENPIVLNPPSHIYDGYKRQTWVRHVGGGAADTVDYRILTVQVTNSQMAGSVRKTTVIAPF